MGKVNVNALLASDVREAKAQAKDYLLHDGQGLSLLVRKNGTKVFRYRFRYDGKNSTMNLGNVDTMSLKDARKSRQAARDLLDQGINPVHKKRAKRQASIDEVSAKKEKYLYTFNVVTERWMDYKKESWSPHHYENVKRRLNQKILPHIGAMPIMDIKADHVFDVIELMTKNGTVETASKVLQWTKAIFSYAILKDIIQYSPVNHLKVDPQVRKKVKHHNYIDLLALPRFFKKLHKSELHVTTKSAILFTILTAVRTNEVRGAKWEEIDMANRRWIIPAERMKAREVHHVPLSDQAIAVLKDIGKFNGQHGYIFKSMYDAHSPISSNTMIFALYKIGYRSKATMHGFRATFSTTAHDEGKNTDHIEAALAHQERNKVKAAYQRSNYYPQRVKLMSWWGRLVEEAQHGN